MSAYAEYKEYRDEKFKHAKDHMVGLLEDIYTSGNLDDLEFHLDEVANYFDLKISKDEPVICKKQTVKEKQTERMLQNWVGQTRAYAEMMCSKIR